MDDLSFIIPIRVDSDDRINNCLAIVQFLVRYFPAAEIQLIEQDAVSKTGRIVAAYPRIKHNFEVNPGRFNKARAVNQGVLGTARTLICMCDTDILLHPDAILQACTILRKRRGRVVIPHNRICVDVSGAMKDEIVAECDLERYGRYRRFRDVPRRGDARARDCNGGIFLAKRETLLLGGGVNAKMISYGWEDTEFVRRFDRLGYYTILLPHFNLLHLEHHRGADSRVNEMFDINKAEFEKVNAMPRAQLEKYVDSDLDIAPLELKRQRPALRRRQRRENLLRFGFASHLINKIWIKLQIYGATEILRHTPIVRRLRGLGA